MENLYLIACFTIYQVFDEDNLCLPVFKQISHKGYCQSSKLTTKSKMLWLIMYLTDIFNKSHVIIKIKKKK